MGNLPAPIDKNSQVDLIEDSITHPLAVAFNKSSSPNYLAAVEAAKHAHKYSEVRLGKSSMHVAVFSADRVQLSRALHLIRYIKGLKSTRIFAGGKLLASSLQTEEVISCYLSSLECNDWRAHCYRTIRSPFADEAERAKWIDADLDIPWLEPSKPRKFDQYRFPCKFMTRYGEIHFRLEENHPASATDQIQAMAVEHGCAWCPNFKPENFKKL